MLKQKLGMRKTADEVTDQEESDNSVSEDEKENSDTIVNKDGDEDDNITRSDDSEAMACEKSDFIHAAI